MKNETSKQQEATKSTFGSQGSKGSQGSGSQGSGSQDSQQTGKEANKWSDANKGGSKSGSSNDSTRGQSAQAGQYQGEFSSGREDVGEQMDPNDESERGTPRSTPSERTGSGFNEEIAGKERKMSYGADATNAR